MNFVWIPLRKLKKKLLLTKPPLQLLTPTATIVARITEQFGHPVTQKRSRFPVCGLIATPQEWGNVGLSLETPNRNCSLLADWFVWAMLLENSILHLRYVPSLLQGMEIFPGRITPSIKLWCLKGEHLQHDYDKVDGQRRGSLPLMQGENKWI